jgi:hypothetical protein
LVPAVIAAQVNRQFFGINIPIAPTMGGQEPVTVSFKIPESHGDQRYLLL